jgi:hypothetical protein
MTGRAGVAGPLLALVAVALVAGCGGTASVVASPPGTTPAPAASLAIVSVYNLLPGQCFDAVFDKDDDRVLAAIVRSCDEPHGAEVFGTPELSDPAGTPYAEDAVTQAAQEACVPAFRDYVGVEYDASRLEATYYGPYEWTWAAGDRAIICFVQGTPEDPLTKSVKGLRE